MIIHDGGAPVLALDEDLTLYRVREGEPAMRVDVPDDAAVWWCAASAAGWSLATMEGEHRSSRPRTVGADVGPALLRLTGPGFALVDRGEGRRPVPATAGPLEKRGRLRYIDGCTDTLLIGPARLGDPCINHLHFPGGVDQTLHTHPSWRVGMVIGGRGLAKVVCSGELRLLELRPGVVFALPAECLHAFRTVPGETMDVVAWHPDSDVGPTDDAHPMVTRTIVDGTPASRLPEIRTA